MAFPFRTVQVASLSAPNYATFVSLLLLPLAFVLVLAPPTAAQTALRASHAGAGHGAMTGGDYQLRGTVGQPAVSIRGAGPYLGEGFWYAVRNEAVALPVELSAFTAETDGDRVRLQWHTASETNNAGFHLQRRIDGPGATGAGSAFQTVHFAEGAGTTTAPRTYRFTDTDLPFGAETVTYRLRQVDTDGTEAYSKEIIAQRRAPARLALHALFPNPASGRGVTLRYELPVAADVEIAVYDVLGRVVATPITRRQEAGRTETRLALPGLSSGLYFVRLRTGGEVRTQRLTVVR